MEAKNDCSRGQCHCRIFEVFLRLLHRSFASVTLHAHERPDLHRVCADEFRQTGVFRCLGLLGYVCVYFASGALLSNYYLSYNIVVEDIVGEP